MDRRAFLGIVVAAPIVVAAEKRLSRQYVEANADRVTCTAPNAYWSEGTDTEWQDIYSKDAMHLDNGEIETWPKSMAR